MKLKKTILPMVLALSMLAAACGSGGGNQPADSGAAAANVPERTNFSGYSFTAHLASEPESMDPALNTAVDGAVMLGHIFEGLMTWGDDQSGRIVNAALVNGQAENYEMRMEGEKAIWTFYLRDDIYWHDGVEVTAHDFEFAWKRLADPATAADYSYMIDVLDNAIEIMNGEMDPDSLGVRALDAKTLEVTLTFDCPWFLELVAFTSLYPVRRDIIEQYGDQWTFNVRSLIGNGPYRMLKWQHNSFIEIEKSPTYYGYESLGPDTIMFSLMDDDNSILAGFRSGELDFISEMPVDEIPVLLANGEMTIAEYIGTYYVVFNTQRYPFDNPLVREALTLAIDRNFIVDQITRRGEIPATGFIPEGMYDAGGHGTEFRQVGGDYYGLDEASMQRQYNRARELLAEAGYPGGQGFPNVEYLFNTVDQHRAIGEAIQDMWRRELGINITLRNEEWGTFIDTRSSGNYEVARAGWISDYNDPISMLDMFITGGGNNDPQYSDPDYDELIRIAKSTSDPEVRFKAMHDMEDILLKRDWVLAPIYYYVNYWMVKDDVRGIIYTPLGNLVFSHIIR